MTGVFVAVVGPSGAGKDTLIAGARARLGDDPRVLFVRRVVTRQDGGNEDHERIDPERFAARRAAGDFVLAWGAHGLFYGIPASALEAVRAGRVAVANLSRGAVTDARAAFPALVVVNVTAPPAVLAARLAGRGRESRAEIEARLVRRPPALPEGPGIVTLDNGGDLGAAVDRLVDLIGSLGRAADQ